MLKSTDDLKQFADATCLSKTLLILTFVDSPDQNCSQGENAFWLSEGIDSVFSLIWCLKLFALMLRN